MYRTPNVGIFLAILILLSSCAQNNSKLSEPAVPATSETSTSSSQAEEERQTIRTAHIELQVDQVENQVVTLQEVVQKLNGHVYHYEMQSNKHAETSCPIRLDSIQHSYQTLPQAILKIRVPVAKADSFIRTILCLPVQIEQLVLDEEDVTDEIELNQALNQGVAGSVAHSLKQKQYEDGKQEVQIRRKQQTKSLSYRTKFLWFEVVLHGQPRTHHFYTTRDSNRQTPFYVRSWDALLQGWHLFALVFSGLLTLWPFVFFGVIGWWGIRILFRYYRSTKNCGYKASQSTVH